MRNKKFRSEEFDFTVFIADETSFMVTATLISKGNKAVLVGSLFKQEDAQELVELIKKENLDLEAVYLLHGDPDYYFGLETIKQAFPSSIAYATVETFNQIVGTVGEKLGVWKEALGEQLPKNIVLPKMLEDKEITLLGTTWEIVGSDPKRTSLWNSDLKTLLGGIDSFNEIHVFLADTKTKEQMQAWVERLDELIALGAELVIPSHAADDQSFDVKSLEHTKAYLLKAVELLDDKQVVDSEEFSKQMQAAFPNLANTGVLDLSSKVVMGEIPWG